ncbi:MAG: GNAT family N-acetyltransferase [Firmicutes bacterium]|nr:GNAT family N-acetyltransferase [Bacillota bacterium]
MKVVKYESKYKEQVQAVCISQSTSRFKDKKAQQATLALYCDEYINEELAFVLLNEEDKVCGYILCAPDLKHYEKCMEPYVDLLKEIDPDKYQRYYGTLEVHQKFYEDYPAHLHVDLLEEYTGGGNGTRLMKTLLEYLRSISVKGIMITVDPNNTRACAFYNKMGFKKADPEGYILVQNL